MKRLLAILCTALLLTACHQADPVIKGCRLQQVSSMTMGLDGVSADMTLALDVDNPSSATYTVESLEAVVYRGAETAQFATAVMQESASIAPKSGQTIDIPMKVKLLRPLALLSGGQDALDLSQYCADVDLTVRKGAIKKRIQKERIPLSSLEQLLHNPSNPEEK